MFPKEKTGRSWNREKGAGDEGKGRETGFLPSSLVQRIEFVERTPDIEHPPGDEERHCRPSNRIILAERRDAGHASLSDIRLGSPSVLRSAGLPGEWP